MKITYTNSTTVTGVYNSRVARAAARACYHFHRRTLSSSPASGALCPTLSPADRAIFQTLYGRPAAPLMTRIVCRFHSLLPRPCCLFRKQLGRYDLICHSSPALPITPPVIQLISCLISTLNHELQPYDKEWKSQTYRLLLKTAQFYWQ